VSITSQVELVSLDYVVRSPRVRGLLKNKTYMGIHEFGKRTSSGRPIVARAVPAIVTEQVWKKAQATLKAHLLFGVRGATGHCNLTYIGMPANRQNGRNESYYRCNGGHTPELLEKRCESKSIRGDLLEQQVWNDIVAFLRDPKPVLQQLQARLESDAQGTDQTRERLKRLENLLAEKVTERHRVVALYRRGRLTDAALDDQMEEIGKEEAGLQSNIDDLRAKLDGVDSVSGAVSSAEVLLANLRTRLDQPVSWEQKRKLVEVLVAGVRVDTVETCGVKQAKITVTYRFSQPDEAGRLLLAQSYTPQQRCVRIPVEPKTVGDHIRRKRLALKMLQKQIAERIGVDTSSVFNWESNKKHPDVRFMPAIIAFLGYNPLPGATTYAQRLVRHRTSLGLSQEASARRIGVDPSTLARWERGERVPKGAAADRAERLLAEAEEMPALESKAG
jgi:transcriptional regulator with XRE-family HTH domain